VRKPFVISSNHEVIMIIEEEVYQIKGQGRIYRERPVIVSKNQFVVSGLDKTFNSRKEAEEAYHGLVLDQFVNKLFRTDYDYCRSRSNSLGVRKLCINGETCMSFLREYLELTIGEQPYSEEPLVAIDINQFGDEVDYDKMIEITAELVWRVLIGGQSTISPKPFKARIKAKPELFWRGMTDLSNIYAWRKLSGKSE
jgi:hypothetical protein